MITPSTAPGPPTSLDPHETNPQTASERSDLIRPLPSSRVIAFRHSGWAPRRRRVYRALIAIGETESRDIDGGAIRRSRLDRYVWCGDHAWLVQSATDPGRLRVSASYCRDRMCQPCQRTRANRIRTTLQGLIQGQRCRLVTLTLRHRPEPLTDTLDRLYECFSALRRRRLWSSRVDAAAAVVEITRQPAAGTWHVHLHVIAIGSYMHQAALSREWLAVTGDSPVVDVRALWRNASAATYVTKYLTKQCDAATFGDPSALAEYIVAMKGRRQVATYGAWRGVKLICDPAQEEWIEVCPLEDLLQRAADGDPAAADLAARLIEREDLPVEEYPP